MRRLLLPVSILMVAIVASVLAVRADNAADPTPRDADDSTPPRLDRAILSGTRIPEWLLRPETDAALGDEARRVLTVLPYPPDSMCLSVNRDGNEVASESAVEPHVPGRLQRLVTTAVALEILPPDSVFTTDVVMQSGTPIVDGVLEGDIWIIGRGDPTLSTAAYIDRFGDGRARTDISELAAAPPASGACASGPSALSTADRLSKSSWPISVHPYLGCRSPCARSRFRPFLRARVSAAR